MVRQRHIASLHVTCKDRELDARTRTPSTLDQRHPVTASSLAECYTDHMSKFSRTARNRSGALSPRSCFTWQRDVFVNRVRFWDFIKDMMIRHAPHLRHSTRQHFLTRRHLIITVICQLINIVTKCVSPPICPLCHPPRTGNDTSVSAPSTVSGTPPNGSSGSAPCPTPITAVALVALPPA